MKFLVMILILTLIIPQNAFSLNGDDLSLIGHGLGKNKNSEIHLEFNGNELKNAYLWIAKDGGKGDKERLVLDNPKLKIKGDNFLIIDDDRNFIYGKQKESGNYVLVSKINLDDSRIRILFNSDKTSDANPEKIIDSNTEKSKSKTRDLIQESQSSKSEIESQLGSESFKEKQLREKNEKLEAEYLKFQKSQEDRLNNKELKNTQQLKKLDAHTRQLLDQVKADNGTKTAKQLREESANRGKSTDDPVERTPDDQIKIVILNSHSVEWKSNFLVRGYVFDPQINKDDDYSFVYGRISDVRITGEIKDVNNKIVHSFTEITDKRGFFSIQYFIPDNSITGEYKLTINAEKQINNKKTTDKLTGSFFVKYLKSGSGNHLPTAFANLDQFVYFNFHSGNMISLNLNGTGSFDPEQRPLSYQWTQVNVAEAGPPLITLGNDLNTITPEITLRDIEEFKIFDFQLIVNDGDSDSLPDQIRITAHNSTLSITNGTLYDFAFDYGPSSPLQMYSDPTTIMPMSNAIGYNVHIIGDSLNSGKLNMTINVEDQMYDIVDADIYQGEYKEMSANNVQATNGSSSSFTFDTGRINNYPLDSTPPDNFDLINGIAFNIHKINNDVMSGLVNATLMNNTFSYDLSFVKIEMGNFTNGFFNFTSLDETPVSIP